MTLNHVEKQNCFAVEDSVFIMLMSAEISI